MIYVPGRSLIYCISHYMVTYLAKGQKTFLPATYTPTLVIFRKGGVTLGSDNMMEEKAPPAYIEGPALCPRYSTATENSEIISLHFKPAMLQNILFMPASEFSNCCISLNDIGNPYLNDLVNIVVSVSCINEAIQMLERKLNKLLVIGNEKFSRETRPFFVSREIIYKSTKELASVSGLSVRQLERRFKQSYGVTVRDWRRLNRAASAVMELITGQSNSLNVADVANNANYFDHAHMCREFRSLCGVSPSELVHRITDDPAYWPLRELRKLNVASIQDRHSAYVG